MSLFHNERRMQVLEKCAFSAQKGAIGWDTTQSLQSENAAGP